MHANVFYVNKAPASDQARQWYTVPVLVALVEAVAAEQTRVHRARAIAFADLRLRAIVRCAGED
jgi:VanZ family protein